MQRFAGFQTNLVNLRILLIITAFLKRGGGGGGGPSAYQQEMKQKFLEKHRASFCSFLVFLVAGFHKQRSRNRNRRVLRPS